MRMVRAVVAVVGAVMAGAVLAVIALYKVLISPLLPAACRFLPTCSEYAADAVRVHGPAKGGLLAIVRIGRCNPWGCGGHEEVPPAGTPLRAALRRPTLRRPSDAPAERKRAPVLGHPSVGAPQVRPPQVGPPQVGPPQVEECC